MAGEGGSGIGLGGYVTTARAIASLFSGGGGSQPPKYARKGFVRKTLRADPSLDTPREFNQAWKNPATRAALIARAAYALYSDLLSKPGSKAATKFRKRYEAGSLFQGGTGRIPNIQEIALLEPSIAAAELQAQILRNQALPGPPQTLPQFPAPSGPQPAWLELLQIAAEQYRIYLEQKAAREAENAQRRALQMALSDSFGTVLNSVVGAAPAALQTYFTAKAAEQQQKQALKLARLGAGFTGLTTGGVGPNYSGVPLPGVGTGAALGALGMLLGEEPGPLASGGILETLGLEGDVERTVTLWKRSGAGFRPNRTITAQNPSSGSLSTWVNMGRPVLYTGDIAACRRVNRISARVARVARRRGATAGRTFRRARRA